MMIQAQICAFMEVGVDVRDTITEARFSNVVLQANIEITFTHMKIWCSRNEKAGDSSLALTHVTQQKETGLSF